MVLDNNNLNSFSISSIGFGCDFQNNSEVGFKKLNKLINECLHLGINFFDTAPVYGKGESEKIIGKIVKPKREKVFLATKVSPNNTSCQGIIKSLEESLNRLQTDYIDLYQVHWPNPKVPISETMLAMEKLVEVGKIRFIGVSNFSLNEIKEAMNHLKNNSLASIQAEYNLFERSIENDLIPFAIDNNIIIIAYSPMAQGRLANGKKQIKMLNKLAKKYNATSGQIVLRFLIDKPEIMVIPNTTKLDRLIENINSVNLDIEPEDIKIIDKVCRTEISFIETNTIRVSGEYNRNVYSTLDEAMQNKMEMAPSPIELAEEIQHGEFLKPIRLKKLPREIDGKKYDLIEGRLRYWAWVIAFGWDKSIPALVWET